MKLAAYYKLSSHILQRNSKTITTEATSGFQQTKNFNRHQSRQGSVMLFTSVFILHFLKLRHLYVIKLRFFKSRNLGFLLKNFIKFLSKKWSLPSCAVKDLWSKMHSLKTSKKVYFLLFEKWFILLKKINPREIDPCEPILETNRKKIKSNEARVSPYFAGNNDVKCVSRHLVVKIQAARSLRSVSTPHGTRQIVNVSKQYGQGNSPKASVDHPLKLSTMGD